MKTAPQIIFLLLFLFCALYGGLIFSVNSGSRFYLVWIAGALFFLGCAGCARYGWFSLLPVPLRTALLVIFTAAILLLLVLEALVLSRFHDKADTESHPLDVLIVLGAQVRENGPSVVLRYRLDTAYAYLSAHPETVCIVTGGQGENEPAPEADMMRAYLVEKGISPERILAENTSMNTAGNIVNSLPLFDPANDHVGIVTNNFHMYRALAIAKKQGIANVTGIAAPSGTLYLPNNMLREAVGICKDKLTGNL